MLFFAGMVFIRTSGFLLFLNVLMVIYLLLHLAQLEANKNTSYVGEPDFVANASGAAAGLIAACFCQNSKVIEHY